MFAYTINLSAQLSQSHKIRSPIRIVHWARMYDFAGRWIAAGVWSGHLGAPLVPNSIIATFSPHVNAHRRAAWHVHGFSEGKVERKPRKHTYRKGRGCDANHTGLVVSFLAIWLVKGGMEGSQESVDGHTTILVRVLSRYRGRYFTNSGVEGAITGPKAAAMGPIMIKY